MVVEQTTTVLSASTELWTLIISVCVGITVAVGLVSLLFELLSIVFILTPTDKDDKWLAKVEKHWLKIKPYMELLHVKTPAMLVINKVLKKARKLREILEMTKK